MTKSLQYLALNSAINGKTIYSIDFEGGKIETNTKSTIKIQFCESFKSTISAILCKEPHYFYFKNFKIYF